MARSLHNILVTGGAGFIGSAFVRHLLGPESSFAGVCINLDLLTYAGNLENLATVAQHPRYVFQRGDICNEKLVEHLCQEYDINCIIHFAAESHVDRSIQEPSAFLQTNILGTFHLLEVVRRHPKIHFHHVSTDEVYGSLGAVGYFTETSSYQPNSPYSASKASSDHLVRAYQHTYGLSTCVSHCGNNYGPYQYPEKLIPVIILHCLQNKPLPIYGQGTNVRDWIYVQDHVEALMSLLERGTEGENYNIGSGAERRNLDLVYEIIHCLARLQGKDPSTYERLVTFVQDRPGHDQRYALDSTKIREELGWEPRFTLQQGLETTIQWHLKESVALYD